MTLRAKDLMANGEGPGPSSPSNGEGPGPSSPSNGEGPGPSSPSWPGPPSAAAYHGLAGEIVTMIEPHSEADPVALLVQFLVAFGNCIGRSAHFRVEGDQHYTNGYVALIGETSKGRKGTSLGQVRRLYKAAAADWLEDCAASGLSTGEGLIHRVRDPTTKETPLLDDDGEPTGDYQQQIVDDGVSEKRLFVVEAEFAKVLKNMHRDTNTLSIALREAWDAGELQTMTRNAPMKATGAHISLDVMITRDELRRLLDATDAANGFANRFLLVCVRRSKALPEGGNLTAQALDSAAGHLRGAIAFAAGVGEMRRNDAARQLWAEVYPSLSAGRPGLLGAVTSRAEAHVLRLSLLYALLDHSRMIKLEHLQAALALWDYCERSAAHLFGNKLGDPDADKVLAALRDVGGRGMDRTAISRLFGGHKPAERIDTALQLLRDLSLAYPMFEESGGRHSEVWRPSQRTESSPGGQGLISHISLLSHPKPSQRTESSPGGQGLISHISLLSHPNGGGGRLLFDVTDDELLAAFPGSSFEEEGAEELEGAVQ